MPYALFDHIGKVGNNVISLDMQKAMLELDKRLEVLINSASIREHYPEKEWSKDVESVLSQLLILLEELPDNQTKIGVEAWLEVFREKHIP